MKMRSLTAVILLFVSVSAIAATETGNRDQQWIFRQRHGDGTASPTAIFLSWNYANVLMKAECRTDKFGNPGRAGNGGMSFHYYPGSQILAQDEAGRIIDQPFEPFIYTRGKDSVSFPAKVGASAVTANFDITPKVLSILKPAQNDLEITATNEMDEPWHVGQAEPLYRLAQACARR